MSHLQTRSCFSFWEIFQNWQWA